MDYAPTPTAEDGPVRFALSRGDVGADGTLRIVCNQRPGGGGSGRGCGIAEVWLSPRAERAARI